ERHLELGVDPEQRRARAVVAERAGRRQRAEEIRAHRIARETEAEPEIGWVRLPAVIDRDALVQLVRLVAGPVAGRELQRRRGQDAPAVEGAAAAQHLGEAEQIGDRRYAADPRHLRVLVGERALRARAVAAQVLLRRPTAKVRENMPVRSER